MNRALTAFVIGLTLIAAVPTIGCSGTTRAGTRYTLNPGRATEAFVGASVEEAFSASRRSMENLRYEIVTARQDATQGLIKGKTARNEDITIHVDRDSPNVSKVTILVGLPAVGDTERQLMILNNIEDELGIGVR